MADTSASVHGVEASNVGGYDLDFLEEVPARFICQICAKPYRDPHLTVCCGQHYCQSCLQQWFAKNAGAEQCPHCRATRVVGDFNHVLNKSLRSEISELKVRCSNKKMGCTWIGELAALREHLERVKGPGCDYSKVVCPNRCASGWTTIRRIDLKVHLETQCLLRPYECEQCHYKSTYEDIVVTHYHSCPELPVYCPNDCGLTKIKRREVDGHRKNDCPLEEMQCPFSEVGCTEKVVRYQFGEHLSCNSEHHLLLVMAAYREVKQTCEELQRRVDDLEGHYRPPKRRR